MNAPCLSKCCIQFDWCSGFSNACDNKSASAAPLIGGVIGGFFLLVILIVGFAICWRRRKATELLMNATADKNSETKIIMANKQPAY